MSEAAHATAAQVADDELDGVVARLRSLNEDQQREVLGGLDPTFRKAILDRMLGRLTPKAQEEVLRRVEMADERFRPRTDEELWLYVLEEAGVRIPRKAVCPGHCSPWDAFSDAYFERGNMDKLWIGNRGSGKTFLAGVLHAVSARTKVGWSGCTIGATKEQAHKAYGYFRNMAERPNWRRLLKRKKVFMHGTEFTNRSSVEIVTGTLKGVNSPHPNMSHWDEVELLRDGVFQEGLNMAQSGNGHRAMNLLTSSWKKTHGFISDLRDKNAEAERSGGAPPYQVYAWCVWETTEPCEHDCSMCPFADVVNGTLPDGSPRSFEWACKRDSPEPGVGKLKFTDGFVSIEDATRRFRTLTQRMWESQQESRRPTLEGVIYDWDETRYDVSGWAPETDIGEVFVSMDFGTHNSAGFYQRVKSAQEVQAEGRVFVVPEGAWVRFDEVYLVEAGAVEFGRAVNRKVMQYEDSIEGFHVSRYYGDPAAAMAMRDLRNLHRYRDSYDPDADEREFRPIWCVSRKGIKVDDGIQIVRDEVVDRGLLFCAVQQCPKFVDQMGQYEWELDASGKPTGRPKKVEDHSCDEFRYLVVNEHLLAGKPVAARGPVAAARPRHVVGSAGEWRNDFGEPRPAEYGKASPVVIGPGRRGW